MGWMFWGMNLHAWVVEMNLELPRRDCYVEGVVMVVNTCICVSIFYMQFIYINNRCMFAY